MYEPFFGLQREPFSVAPDSRFLFMSDKHREALAHLQYGLRGGGGFVLLTGEIGAGKTTVWRTFLEQLPSNFDVSYVVNPKVGINGLLTRVCDDLHVDLPGGVVVTDPIDAIHGHLLLTHASGRRTLIVVDEAQALSVEVLEQLRLLTNLVTADRKLVQVLLIGQPELRTLLEQPVLEPTAQRVVARFHLPALSEEETTGYIRHRLTVAGLTGALPFDADALARIHQLCGGVPRRINVLCDRALLGAHTLNQRRVDRALVDRAAGEVFGRRTKAAPPQLPLPLPSAGLPGWVAVAGVAGAALVLGVLLAPGLAALWRPGGGATLPSAGAAKDATVPVAVAPSSVPQPVGPTAPQTLPQTSLQTPSQTPPQTPTLAAPQATAQAAALPVAAPHSAGAMPAPAPTALDALFAAPLADEARAWRALAGQWGLVLAAGDPCAAALPQGLHCYRGRGGLAPIRQVDRPVVLTLTDERGRSAHALLVGLSDDVATLRIGNFDHSVPLAQLARAWRGEFATFWRAPPGYREGELAGAGGPLSAWLAQRLAAVDGQPAAEGAEALAARVFAFQLANGLAPDGLAGPLTLMKLNRASGVDEPRLLAPK